MLVVCGTRLGRPAQNFIFHIFNCFQRTENVFEVQADQVGMIWKMFQGWPSYAFFDKCTSEFKSAAHFLTGFVWRGT